MTDERVIIHLKIFWRVFWMGQRCWTNIWLRRRQWCHTKASPPEFSWLLSFFMVVACDCQHVMYTLGAIYIRGVWPPQSERGDTGPVERDPAPPDGVPFQSSGSQHLTLGSRPRKCARRSVSVLVCSVISLNLTPNPLTPQPSCVSYVSCPSSGGRSWMQLKNHHPPIGLFFCVVVRLFIIIIV